MLTDAGAGLAGGPCSLDVRRLEAHVLLAFPGPCRGHIGAAAAGPAGIKLSLGGRAAGGTGPKKFNLG